MPDKEKKCQQIQNDLPAQEDRLGRGHYINTLCKMLGRCQTPLVLGIYGPGGGGKTSFMQILRNRLEGENLTTVWLNACRHQHTEGPAISLLHEIKIQAPLRSRAKIENLPLLTLLNTFAGRLALQYDTGGACNLTEMVRLGAGFEEEFFKARTISQRFFEHFAKLVQEITNGRERLIVFIDDLDRCYPHYTANLLEAINLQFCVKGCIFVIATAGKKTTRALKSGPNGDNGLDRVVHIPFNLPPLQEHLAEDYLQSLNHRPDFNPFHYELIKRGMGDNPRKIKKFFNLLALGDTLAREVSVPGYDLCVLIKLLLFQQRFYAFYREIEQKPDSFFLAQRLARNEAAAEVPPALQSLLQEEELKKTLAFRPLPAEIKLDDYLELLKTTREIHSGENRNGGGQPILPQENDAPTSKNGPKSAEKQGLLLKEPDKPPQKNRPSPSPLPSQTAPGMDLRGAYLGRANLVGAALGGADLRHADLGKARLQGADLRRADLCHCHLWGADLSRADLSCADLNGADLRESNLEGADLSGVCHFQEVKSLAAARLNGVKGLSAADLEFAATKGAIIS